MRPHATRSAVPAALLSLFCAAAVACFTPAMFGPRDRGGVYMVLAIKADGPALEQAVRNASQVIETRCSALGVYCQVERQGGEGSNRIRLRVSGAQDFERVKAVLLAEGRLELRPVISPPSPSPLKTYPTRAAAGLAAGADYDMMPFEEGPNVTFLAVERTPVITGQDLRDARAMSRTGDGTGVYEIAFTLGPDGAERFGVWTGANVGRYLAIVLNGEVRSVPYIQGQITDSGQISGPFDRQQAEDIALTLRSGSLPAPVEVLEEGAYKP